MEYVNVKLGAIPGVKVKGGAAYCAMADELFPITAFLAHEKLGLIPILDIPQMSDERWQELARAHPVPKGAAV